MTQQEYEQKREQEWRAFCNRHGIIDRGHVILFSAFFDAFDRAYALGKQEKDAEDDRTLKVNRQLFCRLCADADDYINEHLEEEDGDYTYYQGRSDALHELYRGEWEAATTVIQGWVCRDKKDNALNLHLKEPYRTYSNFSIVDKTDLWESDCASFLPLDNSLFPDLTWESDPQECEIIIKRKKNG